MSQPVVSQQPRKPPIISIPVPTKGSQQATAGSQQSTAGSQQATAGSQQVNAGSQQVTAGSQQVTPAQLQQEIQVNHPPAPVQEKKEPVLDSYATWDGTSTMTIDTTQLRDLYCIQHYAELDPNTVGAVVKIMMEEKPFAGVVIQRVASLAEFIHERKHDQLLAGQLKASEEEYERSKEKLDAAQAALAASTKEAEEKKLRLAELKAQAERHAKRPRE